MSQQFLFPSCTPSLQPPPLQLSRDTTQIHEARDHRGKVRKASSSTRAASSSWWNSLVEDTLDSILLEPIETREELHARMQRALEQQQKEKEQSHQQQLQHRKHLQQKNRSHYSKNIVREEAHHHHGGTDARVQSRQRQIPQHTPVVFQKDGFRLKETPRQTPPIKKSSAKGSQTSRSSPLKQCFGNTEMISRDETHPELKEFVRISVHSRNRHQQKQKQQQTTRIEI